MELFLKISLPKHIFVTQLVYYLYLAFVISIAVCTISPSSEMEKKLVWAYCLFHIWLNLFSDYYKISAVLVFLLSPVNYVKLWIMWVLSLSDNVFSATRFLSAWNLSQLRARTGWLNHAHVVASVWAFETRICCNSFFIRAEMRYFWDDSINMLLVLIRHARRWEKRLLKFI